MRLRCHHRKTRSLKSNYVLSGSVAYPTESTRRRSTSYLSMQVQNITRSLPYCILDKHLAYQIHLYKKHTRSASLYFLSSPLQAGPLQSVRIPVDRDTKKQKPFAFVLFSHAESLPFAYELFRDVKLYGRPLRMQNKETGLGMGAGSGGGRSYNRSDSDRGRRPGQQLEVTLSQHHRSVSVPENFHQGHQPVPFQQQYQQCGGKV